MLLYEVGTTMFCSIPHLAYMIFWGKKAKQGLEMIVVRTFIPCPALFYVESAVAYVTMSTRFKFACMHDRYQKELASLLDAMPSLL